MARTVRSTAEASVCQPQTETRIHRRPRQVVQANSASPEATILAVTSWVQRS